MTTPATTASTWTDADVLTVLAAHDRIARHRAAGARGGAIECWADTLAAFKAAVQAGHDKRANEIRPVVAALACSYAQAADLVLFDHLDSAVGAAYGYGLARHEKHPA
jgi:hypothetical protein